MMRRNVFAAMAVATMIANTSMAQLDLGGAISGAINGATGGTQAAGSAATQAGAQAGNSGSVGGAISGAINGAVNGNQGINPSAGINANAGVNASGLNNGGTALQNGNQTWLGRVGNDIRNAVQQADNGAMRLQNNLDPSLQQYGFRPGDQLLDANGQPLTQAHFDQYLQNNNGPVRVLRNGQTVVLGGNVQAGGQLNSQGSQFYGQSAQMGAQMGSQGMMQSSGRQRFGITMCQSNEGVFVQGVTVGSPAAQAGIRPGDQIVSVNGQAISDPNSMIQLVGSANGDQPLDVQYRRNGQDMSSKVTLSSASNQSGVYQAGYGQGMDQRGMTRGGMQGSMGSGMQGNADINARLDRLERMVQDLHDQIKSQAPEAPRPTDR